MYKIKRKKVKKGNVYADFMEDALRGVMRKHKGMEIVSLNKKGDEEYEYKVEKILSNSFDSLQEIAELEEKGWEIVSIDKINDPTEQMVEDNDVYGYNQGNIYAPIEKQVDSSWINKIDYFIESKEMEIATISGKNYIYEDVPYSIYQDFLEAESAGRYFNDKIKGNFERKGNDGN